MGRINYDFELTTSEDGTLFTLDSGLNGSQFVYIRSKDNNEIEFILKPDELKELSSHLVSIVDNL